MRTIELTVSFVPGGERYAYTYLYTIASDTYDQSSKIKRTDEESRPGAGSLHIGVRLNHPCTADDYEQDEENQDNPDAGPEAVTGTRCAATSVSHLLPPPSLKRMVYEVIVCGCLPDGLD